MNHIPEHLKTRPAVQYFTGESPFPFEQETPPLKPIPAAIAFLARPFTYLACPYSHPDSAVRERRFEQVTCAASWLIRNRGWNVFSPITHSHPLATVGGIPGDWDFWRQIDREYMEHSCRMVVLEVPGWEHSKGIRGEIKIAEELGVPVSYMRLSGSAYEFSMSPMTGETESFWRAINAPPVELQPRTPVQQPSGEPDADTGKVRTFLTGATRDSEDGKFDYEGFLSSMVLEEFGRYMNTHRKQSDGTLRASDNWQKGIPKTAYIKSLFRHFVQLWKLHRGLYTEDEKGAPVSICDAACAIMFNVMGYLHEHLKK